MYERMLDKSHEPTEDEFARYCGKSQQFFKTVDFFLTEQSTVQKSMRFPYGNKYGWGIKYQIKNQHICDLFAEKDAFTIMLRLSKKQFDNAYQLLDAYAQNIVKNQYPCGEGGWINYRVTEPSHLDGIKKLLRQKLAK